MSNCDGSAPIPVLWLSGPPAAGKTTVGWELFTQLSTAGVEVSYVDIDQLGVCYPEGARDPGRHRLKARNLGAVVANFQLSGARCVIVSGVVDSAHGVHRDEIPTATVTACRLQVDRDELRTRLIGRGLRADQIDEVLNEAEAVDRSDYADICIETRGRSVSEIAHFVRNKWPFLQQDSPRAAPTPGADPVVGPILWLCGATGVGKSSIGWRVFEKVRESGLTAAFIDLDQIGFRRPIPADDPGNHRLKARNLAAMVRTYRAPCVIVVGPVDDVDTVARYTAELPFRLFRLHAGRERLAHRIMLRGRGSGPRLPGDPLFGQPAATLRRVADEASARADALERAGIGELRIDTDDSTIDESAQAILDRISPQPTQGGAAAQAPSTDRSSR